jgi:hypothetical protein
MHTSNTIAGIRETTQLLLDLYRIEEDLYIHPLKVWKRYSATMFFPHQIRGEEVKCITSSYETSELFSRFNRRENLLDYWDKIINDAKEILNSSIERQEEVKRQLMNMMIGKESRIIELCDKYFTLRDMLDIAAREVGTGLIGGKSIGMLIARKILIKDKGEEFVKYLEPHDSFYLGTDVFYTYVIENDGWRLRIKQKRKEGYYKFAPELKKKLESGQFSRRIKEKFVRLLEYFGQSPIILRSSSLLEDNFGNAFAGKYESVFCVNQGTPQERYEAFENAVRKIYASTMDEDALAYRMNRGIFEKDEQMAILVQRVSGDYYGQYFFPHAAGVGFSTNLYVWNKNIDVNAGMLRMVFGLGTRAVDRTVTDYAKIVCLDDPLRKTPMNLEDYKKFSQHEVDVLSFAENKLLEKSLEEIIELDIKTDKNIFVSQDYETMKRLRDLGYTNIKTPYILDFEKMLKKTSFPKTMQDILMLLKNVYEYPVDIEFTVNFSNDGGFKINLLQCRPLQTKGLGKSVKMPKLNEKKECFISTKGNFMGGNMRLPIDYVIYVNEHTYQSLSNHDKYSIARNIGFLNNALKDKSIMLVGPGRWGTTTPSLGVPVNFSEICNVSVICEVASKEAGFMPELSYGSHFFQDLVEADIFYVAIFDDRESAFYNPSKILEEENKLIKFLPGSRAFTDVLHIAETEGMEFFSDIETQILLCCKQSK